MYIGIGGLSIPGRRRRRRRIGDCYLDRIAVCSALCYPVNKYRPGINKPLTSMGIQKIKAQIRTRSLQRHFHHPPFPDPLPPLPLPAATF